MKLKMTSPLMEKISELNPKFTISAHREPALDGRNNLGAGYIIVISDGKAYFTTEFNNSRANGEKQLAAEDVLGCIVSDAMSYEYSKDIDDFYNEFGYSSISEALKVYDACKRTATALQAMFPGNKLEKVSELLNEAGY